jgi:hypothetical protein
MCNSSSHRVTFVGLKNLIEHVCNHPNLLVGDAQLGHLDGAW